jgi:phosphate starvation-inducible PhoH-like protein
MKTRAVLATMICCFGTAAARRAPPVAALHYQQSAVHVGPPKLLPRTAKQGEYYDMLRADGVDITVGVGPAGCGKTLFACIAAMNALNDGVVDHVIFTRPLVSVDNESLGFFPGTMEKKMEAWTMPFFDAAREVLGAGEVARLRRAGSLEVIPLAYMRGRTFKNTFVIADEMQNSSPTQMQMLATRIGEGSRLALLGDPRQSDRLSVNGLADFESRAASRNSTRIKCVRFGTADVQRSAIAAEVVAMYDEQL